MLSQRYLDRENTCTVRYPGYFGLITKRISGVSSVLMLSHVYRVSRVFDEVFSVQLGISRVFGHPVNIDIQCISDLHGV